MYKKSIKYHNAYTLIEVLIVVAIISVSFLGVIKGYLGINRALYVSRQKSISTNLAHAELESFKNLDYEQVYVTTQADLDSYGYDNTYYPPETHSIDKIIYTRKLTIKKLRESGSDLIEITPDKPDEGIKKIELTVDWTDTHNISKTFTLTNIIENPDRAPKSGKIIGEVRKASDSSDILGATVSVIENPNWTANTDSDGEFEVSVSTGDWRLKVTKRGYIALEIGTYTVVENQTTQVPIGDLDLAAKPLGGIWGLVKSTNNVPVIGAIVSCDDDTSLPVVTLSTGPTGFNDPDKNYQITNVSTGTWIISASTGAPLNMYGETAGTVVTSGGNTQKDVTLSSATIYGSISGYVNMKDTGDNSGVQVKAGGVTVFTNSSGYYTLKNVPSGAQTVLINSSAYDPSYTSVSSTLTVLQGQDVSVSEKTIYPAGKISGTVFTAGGIDFYPDIVLVAVGFSGIDRGNGLSDSNGDYEIGQLPVNDNPYTIYPVLYEDDASVPADIIENVSKGGNETGKDFNLTTAWGYIYGNVYDNGDPINSGVVVMVSTATISDPPPDMTSGEAGIFGGISSNDGSYKIKVLSSDTYYIYAWYTVISGNSTATTRKDDSGITLSGVPPAVTGIDFNWP